MRVLVTRPASEARRWVDALQDRGFDAASLPLIEIVSPADGSEVQEAWRELPRFRAAMFVSGNAVRHFFAQAPSGPAWPGTVRAWATGNGTREALLDAGVAPASIDSPAPDAPQFDSENLWPRVVGQVHQGDRVLIVRGRDAAGDGRDWLASQLAAAGAAVHVTVAYLRQAPEWQAAQLALAREAAADGSAWLFSSSQAIAHLRSLLPQQGWSRARAITTHGRIGQAAREAGFGVVCESRPTVDAVVAALESFR